VSKEDDISDVLFKLFEQLRLMNEEMGNHLSL
jgi:hypothetical protein